MRLDDSYKFVNYDWDWADFWIGSKLGCIPLCKSIVDRFPDLNVRNIDLSDPNEMILFEISPENFEYLVDTYFSISLRVMG